MKKFIVETYYTCTFKTVHTLDNLNDAELSKIDKRSDGDVEVIDVKLNNRKTKKIGDKKETKSNNTKLNEPIPSDIANKLVNANKNDRGINFAIIFVIFKALKYKYVFKECPSSTINSKKFTDLTVQAIIEKANKIVINDLKISLRK